MTIMDAKMNPTKVDAEATKASVRRKSIFTFIPELKDEMKKVSWTTQDELRFSTKIVIGSTFIFGFGVYLIDLGIKGCLELIRTVIHIIFG